jgi:hypothetical protein
VLWVFRRTGEVLITFRSVKYPEFPERAPAFIRVQVKCCGYRLAPVGPNKTKVSFLKAADLFGSNNWTNALFIPKKLLARKWSMCIDRMRGLPLVMKASGAAVNETGATLDG